MFFIDWGGKSLPVLPPLDTFVTFGVRLFRFGGSERACDVSKSIVGCVNVIVRNVSNAWFSVSRSWRCGFRVINVIPFGEPFLAMWFSCNKCYSVVSVVNVMDLIDRPFFHEYL